MESKTVTSSILDRARAAQAAKRVADEKAQHADELRRRAELRSEWQPIVDAVLAQVKHQLGDDGEPAVDDEDESGRTRYYGDGWMLERPAAKTTLEDGDYDSIYITRYRPLKLTIGKDIRTPVMCWSDGRTRVRFEPAWIVIGDEGDCAALLLGGEAISDWGIQQGNDNLLLAIAQAADKQTEYVTKAHRVELINMERAQRHTEPAPEPAAPTPDNLDSAGEILGRFAQGEYCVPAMYDYDMKPSDNQAFLIASQIHALAVEVRELRNTMENWP